MVGVVAVYVWQRMVIAEVRKMSQMLVAAVLVLFV